ncbi:MAG TPA: hypothetical protein VKA89_09030 [Solirubrobacterales bacterium]|nr:hypothetical protein [Solirubrobacterales bacterium]
MRIGKLTVLAGLLALVVGSVTAFGHVKSFSSTVKIDRAERIGQTQSGRYAGEVSSARERCKVDRRVQVWHDSDPPFRIGTTMTNAQGKWRLTGPAPPNGDHVYAVAARKTLLRNARHRHRCRRELSQLVKFPTG